jgi:CheY-like chemotaxis protein
MGVGTMLCEPELETEAELERGFLTLKIARRPRIVVAEDCEDVRDALSPYLRRADYLTRFAADGVEALGAILEFEPDVLLLDLGLPRMHGFKLLHRLRTTAGQLGVRVVVLTGDMDPESRERALRFGVHRVLLKPTPAAKVVAAIDRTLREG